MTKISITSNVRGPRLQYVVDFIFSNVLKIPVERSYSERLNDRFVLTDEDSNRSIEIPNSGFLAENEIRGEWKAHFTKVLGEWSVQPTSILQTDSLALVFFLLSRYEEYLDFEADVHGRFPSAASCLSSSGQLQTPIVDQIVDLIKEALHLPDPPMEPALTSTIDIDFPWFATNLKLPYRLAKSRWQSGADPYDTYDSIVSAHRAIAVRPRFFMLTGGRSEFEKIRRFRHKPYRQLAQKLKADADIGIHPPYMTMNDQSAMTQSIKDYRRITGESPTHSRQHYLRLQLPDTYQIYIQTGMTHDYTMGFADDVGFRAGTARSYLWYDLSAETTTKLRIVPLIAMDVTLRQYLNLSPDQALDQLLQLKSTIDRYGGSLGLLWHNSSLSSVDGWEAYADVYFRFLETYRTDRR